MTDLKAIQAHVGVPADGILGPATLAAIAKALGITSTGIPVDPFARALSLILRHEGGFVNHPKDPGGMTNLGVTRKTLEGWRGRAVTEAEMRALTPAAVAPIYRKNYWDAARCDDLHPALALCVFDFAVNAGPGRAVKLLQSIAHVPVDGAIGPQTIAAANKLDPADAARRYSEARRAYYRSLSTFPTFGKGWLRRVDETEAEAGRLL
ncbi:glycoside hydrolase family 108 protein [Novosphingobium sp. HII-3]|uniref:glycoside hydrolase family 108 protein n=1 Tax=Novosphingobium sp. HII-3 TaxID=2075565 RepID=UPI001E40A1C5|nr:glycosyl hydrolase 108 family protein [Novosphingobium sp. HII-3]